MKRTEEADPVMIVPCSPCVAFFMWKDENGVDCAQARAEDGQMVRVSPSSVREALGDDPQWFHLLTVDQGMAVAARVARQGRLSA